MCSCQAAYRRVRSLAGGNLYTYRHAHHNAASWTVKPFYLAFGVEASAPGLVFFTCMWQLCTMPASLCVGSNPPAVSRAAAGAGATAQAESGCSPLSDSPPRLRPQRTSALVACGHPAAPGHHGALEAVLLQGPAEVGPVDDAAGATLAAGPADTQLGAAVDFRGPTLAVGPAGAPQCNAPPATGPNAEATALEGLCSRAWGWRRVICRLAPVLPPHFVAVSGGPGAGGGALLRVRMGPLDADGRSYAFDEVRL